MIQILKIGNGKDNTEPSSSFSFVCTKYLDHLTIQYNPILLGIENQHLIGSLNKN